MFNYRDKAAKLIFQKFLGIIAPAFMNYQKEF